METETKQKTADIIREIAESNGGEITPEIVLDAARPKDSPLHNHFCWSNSKAAEQYRLIQASCLIRRIKVTIEARDETTVRIREFACVHSDGDDTGEGEQKPSRGIYVNVKTAMGVESYRDQIMADCKRDVETFRRKYAALREAEKIIEAMENFA
jgi:hypothetical protein